MHRLFSKVLVLACLCLLEFRILYILHYPFLQAHMEIVQGILSGHPHWKIFQSRLLGPEAVALASRLTRLSFTQCYWAFCFAMVCLANGTCYFLFSQRGAGRSGAWLVTAAYAALVVAFQDNAWFYLWDYVDLTLMLIFAWAVVTGEIGFWQLVALFFCELANRESAQFIALWMVIDSVRFKPSMASGARIGLDPLRLAAGIVLSIVCALWTRWIRDKLCLGQAGDPLPGVREVGGQMWMLPHLLELLRQTSALTTGAVGIFLGALSCALWLAWKRLGERAWKVGFLIGAMVAANFCFGIIVEVRIWLSLLPILLCLAYYGARTFAISEA